MSGCSFEINLGVWLLPTTLKSSLSCSRPPYELWIRIPRWSSAAILQPTPTRGDSRAVPPPVLGVPGELARAASSPPRWTQQGLPEVDAGAKKTPTVWGGCISEPARCLWELIFRWFMKPQHLRRGIGHWAQVGLLVARQKRFCLPYVRGHAGWM